jgi:WhiB family redox-sensing transcriptional regulator
MLREMSWLADAACKDSDPDLFFPQGDTEARNRQAFAICRGCPVWEQCREWGFASGDRFATLGGVTSRQRARIVNKRKKVAA